MTESHLWAGLAFLAMLGWGATNAVYSFGVKSQANALSTVEKISGFIDGRISAILNRAKTIETKRKPQQPARAQQTAEPEAVMAEAMNEVFGGAPLLFGDQPDADVEVIE